MTGAVRCPQCGARNTAGAPWCTQCLQPLPAPPAEPAAPPPTAPPPAGAAPASTTPPPAPAGDTGRPFRTVDGEVEWRCPGCDTWNPLAVRTCAVCGRALASSSHSADGFADRVARARRPLWGLAVVGGLLMIASVVLLLLALRGGAGA